MRKLLYGLPLVAFLVLAGYFALALRPGYDPHEVPSALIDKPMPAFDLPALGAGPAVTSAALRGHVAVVNFFASWCVPCRIEHPLLMRLAQENKVAITGIAYKDAPPDVAKLLDEGGNPYAQVGIDLGGRTGIDFGVYGVPETYVIDATGRIRKKFVGPLTPEAVNRELLPLLSQLERP